MTDADVQKEKQTNAALRKQNYWLEQAARTQELLRHMEQAYPDYGIRPIGPDGEIIRQGIITLWNQMHLMAKIEKEKLISLL